MHVSTSKYFCEAERGALKERICESVQCKRKGSDCEAGISFSCMFQRANISAKQKGEHWKSGFASLSSAKGKGDFYEEKSYENILYSRCIVVCRDRCFWKQLLEYEEGIG